MVDRFDCYEPLATGREAGSYVRYSDYAELEAENERLKIESKAERLMLKALKEKAEIERDEALSLTGAVKVKALEWIDGTAACLYGAYTIHKRADTMWEAEGYGTFIGGPYADAEAAKAAAQADYERRILSALEPAATCNESLQVAPEGRQNDEPVAHAYVVNGECEQIEWGVDIDLPDDPALVLLYTRPAEQVVTEAMELARAVLAQSITAGHNIPGPTPGDIERAFWALDAALKAATERTSDD